MRSLAPSITLTCTLIVSPGLNAGISSRSDDLSTKSSVFISTDTSLQSRLRADAHAVDAWTVTKADGFGHLGASRSRRERTGRPTAPGDNWSIVPDRDQAVKSSRIADPAYPVTWANGTEDQGLHGRSGEPCQRGRRCC